MQPSTSKDLKPLRKMRQMSGFNAWHAEYLRSTESKGLPTLAAKNKKSGELWKALSSEQQSAYKEKAAAVNAGSVDINIKNECKKIYSLLQDVNEHANMIPGFHLLFVAAHNDKHVVGGTEMGGKFLRESGSHVPYSFLGYLSVSNLSSCNSHSLSASDSPDHESNKEHTNSDSKESLRRSVENLFNLRYGQAIGDTAARLPYKKIQDYGISMDGLPLNKSLKHPSSYGRLTLKQILSNKDNIAIQVTNHPTFQHQQEQHTADPSLTDNTNVFAQDQGGTPPLIHTTNLSDTSNNSNMDHPYSKPFSAGPGSKVDLLVNSKRVGVGTTTGVNLLHGHEIPPEYAAVSIDKIDANICPMYMTSFDEPFLHVGQFTAWPIAQLQLQT